MDPNDWQLSRLLVTVSTRELGGVLGTLLTSRASQADIIEFVQEEWSPGMHITSMIATELTSDAFDMLRDDHEQAGALLEIDTPVFDGLAPRAGRRPQQDNNQVIFDEAAEVPAHEPGQVRHVAGAAAQRIIDNDWVRAHVVIPPRPQFPQAPVAGEINQGNNT